MSGDLKLVTGYYLIIGAWNLIIVPLFSGTLGKHHREGSSFA
jgi:hypothetical protein